MSEDSRKKAVCAQIGGDLWFPESGGDGGAKAIAICNRCPVFTQCETVSIDEQHGIWAATTPVMRAHARGRMRRTA